MSSTIRHIEHCPSCGTNVEGKPQFQAYRQATRLGATVGLKKVIVTAIVAPVVGTIIFPVFGTVIGYIITVIILMKVQSYAKNMSTEIDKKLFHDTKYLFICPSCGATWTKVFDTGISEIPVSVLRQEYTETLKDLGKAKHNNGITALVCAAVFVIGLLYCVTNEPSTVVGQTSTLFGTFDKREWNWGWYIWAFICTIAFVVGCVYGYLWKKNKEAYLTFEEKLNKLPSSDNVQVRLTSGKPVIVTRPQGEEKDTSDVVSGEGTPNPVTPSAPTIAPPQAPPVEDNTPVYQKDDDKTKRIVYVIIGLVVVAIVAFFFFRGQGNSETSNPSYDPTYEVQDPVPAIDEAAPDVDDGENTYNSEQKERNDGNESNSSGLTLPDKDYDVPQDDGIENEGADKTDEADEFTIN